MTNGRFDQVLAVGGSGFRVEMGVEESMQFCLGIRTWKLSQLRGIWRIASNFEFLNSLFCLALSCLRYEKSSS